MKIRCENCYKVLNPQEEYCTACGTHSDKIKHAMETGDYGPSMSDKLKMNLLIYALTAFLCNGVVSIIFAVASEDAFNNLYKLTFGLLISSIVTLIVAIAANIKLLKDFIWNGTAKQLLGASVLSILFIAIVTLFSKVSSITQVIPHEYIDYLSSGKARFFSGDESSVVLMLISFIFIAASEEILFRRVLIDAFDDLTMLSDPAIIIITGLIATVLDFAWIMRLDTLIISFLLQTFMAGLYCKTNRSVGFNIIVRILIIIVQVLIYLV